MDDPRPQTYTVPTELDRQDAYLYLAALALTVILGKYFFEWGGFWPWVIPPVVFAVGAVTLTSKPACDVRGVGMFAVPLRRMLGMRRTDECIRAWAHYWHMVVYPVWRDNCVAFLRCSQRRITACRVQLSEQTRWRVSRMSLWVSRTLHRSLATLARRTS